MSAMLGAGPGVGIVEGAMGVAPNSTDSGGAPPPPPQGGQ
jgi:hypothetical protein